MRKPALSLFVASILIVMSCASSGLSFAKDTLPIKGKGMFIWQLWSATGSGKSLSATIAKLKSCGISWIVIKMGDSDSFYNLPGKSLYTWAAANGGSMDSVISIFHSNGIKVLAFQYVRGDPHYWANVWSETDVANWILDVKGIDGLIIDAEIEYDNLATRVASARAYCDSIRVHHPDGFVGLTAWSRVNSHPTFPWTTFLSRVAVNMPQAYWGARPTTVQNELNLMSTQFISNTNTWVSQGDSAAAKPIMPIGDGYSSASLKVGDITAFANICQTTYNYQGISLWEYNQIPSAYILDEYAAAWVVSAVPKIETHPTGYTLSQNYPNPFNPTTKIEYQVPATAHVMVNVFDVLGREIAVLVNERKQSGNYSVQFNTPANSSGIYFYRLQAGSFVETRKMTVLK